MGWITYYLWIMLITGQVEDEKIDPTMLNLLIFSVICWFGFFIGWKLGWWLYAVFMDSWRSIHTSTAQKFIERNGTAAVFSVISAMFFIPLAGALVGGW